MEEHGRCIRQAVDQVQIDLPWVINLILLTNPQITLEYGDREAADEAAQADQAACEQAKRGIERGKEWRQQIGGSRRRQHGHNEAFPGQVGIGCRGDFMFADIVGGQVVHNIVKLSQYDEQQYQSCAVLWGGEGEIGQVAKTEDHQHQAPLHTAYAAQKSCRTFVDDAGEGEEQEHVYGNKDDEHAVPLNIYPVELCGNGQVCPEIQATLGFA